jgi:peptidoglycan/LPS O-acetylase OafA/YrhL
LSSSTGARVGELAIGAWLALTLREHPEWLDTMRRAAMPVWLGGFAVALLCGIPAGDLKFYNPFMYVVGLAALTCSGAATIVLVLTRRRIAALFSIAPLRHLGTISYGVYVYQILFIDYYQRIAVAIAPHASRNMQAIVVLGVATVLTLAVAEISYWFFERPLLNLKDRFAPSIPPSIPNKEEA